MSIIKAALVQHSHKGSDTRKYIAEKIGEAKGARSDLVCLQELHDYPYFCQVENEGFFDLACNFENDIDYYASLSKKHGIVLVCSLFERRAAGLYHNTAVVLDNGKLAGKYRKMHIPDDPNFYEKYYFTPGDIGFSPIDTSIGRLGVLVCWDQWYPEAARIMALNGAEVLIYPTAIGWFRRDKKELKKMQLEAWVAIQRAHAIANALPVLGINRVGFEASPSSGGIQFWGNSFAFGCFGQALCKFGGREDQIIYATLDLGDIEKTRRAWPFLRDRRIDYYGDLLKRFR